MKGRGFRCGAAMLVALALVAAACGDDGGGGGGGGGGGDTTGGGKPDKVTVQLKWVTQAQFAGFYAAEAQGFYDDENLDVTIKPGGPNITPEQVVASGAAEFGVVIERVFYRAFTSFLVPSSNFSAARAATIQAARELYGTTPAVEAAVTQAWDAVGVTN